MLLLIDWIFILEKLLLVAAVVTIALVFAMYSTYGERKVAAWIQDRRGPTGLGRLAFCSPLQMQ